MDITRGYVLILLTLSLVVQNSAVSDQYWWSRWMPSKETLTGTMWAVPLAVYAQRALAKKTKLPAYSYFIPGALGSAVGTFIRSDQGWSQALLNSLWHNSPSLALAAILWGTEKFRACSAQTIDQQPDERNDQSQSAQQSNNLSSKFRNYRRSLSSLEHNFKEILEQSNISKKQHTTSIVLLGSLKREYDQVVEQYRALTNDFTQYISDNPHDESVKKLAMLTPVEVLYARYVPYMLEEPFNLPLAQLTSDDKKELILSLFNIDILLKFIQWFKAAELGIPTSSEEFLLNFKDDIDKIDNDKQKRSILANAIFLNIYEKNYKQQISLSELTEVPIRFIGTSSLQEQKDAIVKELSRLYSLIDEYKQRINNFVEELFSKERAILVDFKYKYLLKLYSLLKESITWLSSQGGSNLPDMSLALQPYDYIYAAVSARIIKPYVKKFALQENVKSSLDLIFDRIQDPSINKEILNIISKSNLLKNHIDVANSKQDDNRNIRFINKIIQVIKE